MKIIRALFLTFIAFAAWNAAARIDPYAFESEAQKERFNYLIDELRCPKCQNTNLAGSDAPLATDLKSKVHEMILANKSDDDIISYMVARYGDFITYRPPMRGATLMLWFGPIAIFFVVFISVFLWVKRQNRDGEKPLDEDTEAKLKEMLHKYDEDTMS